MTRPRGARRAQRGRALAVAVVSAALASGPAAARFAPAGSSPGVADAGTLRAGRHVIVHAPRRLSALAERVAATCRRELPRLAAEAGLDTVRPVRVDVVDDVGPYRRRLGDALPVWGAAFAVLERDAIVIDATRADRSPGDLDRIVTHELSHLVVAQRVGHARLPMWFLEGVARRQARERSLVDAWQLMMAVDTGRAPALWTLAHRFPRDAGRARDAYRIAGAAVEMLLGHEPGALSRFLGRLAAGEPFDVALARTTGADAGAWMIRFHGELERRFHTRMVVFETAPILGVAALLFVVAIARYQVRKRRRINALDDPSPAVSLDRSRRRGV